MRESDEKATLFDAANPDRRIDQQELLTRIGEGDVVVVRGGWALGQLNQLTRDEIFRQIEDLAGTEKRRILEDAGLDHIHEHLPVDKIQEIHFRATENLRATYMNATEELIRDLSGQDSFYVNHNFVLRFYLPNELMQKHYFELKKRPGKLTQHGPHLDLWQNVALNAYNIWIAIEDVDEGNGMVVYPDAFGKPVPRGGEHIREDQVTGHPLRLPCKAGDMLLFHSQHLHGGVLNRTDRTRVAITTRFTIDAPLHPRLGAQLHYASAAAIRSNSERRIKLSYLADKIRPRNLALRLESRLGSGRPGEEGRRLELLDSWLQDNWFAEYQDRSRESGEHGCQQIAVVDEKTISVETGDGQSVLLQRRCPHMGADLACGYVDDGHIWCPWHDQGFSLEDGQPAGPCSGLKPLRIRQQESSK